MPETPIVTDTGTHPFDAAELVMVRAAVSTWVEMDGHPADGRVNLASYAAVVMPAMADKIEQLRGLYDQAVQDVRAARRDLVRLANSTGAAAANAQAAYRALNGYRIVADQEMSG